MLLVLCVHAYTSIAAEPSVLLQHIAATTSAQEIHFNVTVSSASVWEREQIIVNIEATTPDLYSSLQLESTRIKGLDIYPVEQTIDRFERDGTKLARIQAGWIIYAIADGQYRIQLPDIKYELNGVIRHTLSIPVFTVNIKALPAYIPPTLPVGKVTLKQGFSGGKLVNTHTLAYQELKLTGDGLPAHWLPAVLRQLQSNDDIHYSPVTSERKNNATTTGMRSQVTHTIPFKALSNGILHMPALRIQYFDPEDGRLKTLKLDEQDLYTLSYFWRFVILMVLTGLVYQIAKRLKSSINRLVIKRKHIKNAIQILQHAKNGQDIRLAMKEYSLAYGWSDNLSVTAWQYRWMKKFGYQPELDKLLDTLSKAHYGSTGIVLDSGFNKRLTAFLKH